jgi:membrane protein YdbS with pleckstrin-like domain
MKKYSCDKGILKTARIFIIIVFLIIFVASEYFFMKNPPVMILITIILVGLMLFMCLFYMKKYFENYEIILTENSIKRKSGFFFSKESIMPLEAIQYSSSITAEILTKIGLKGLNTLLIYAYGGMMYIPFLSDDDTQSIKSFLDDYIDKRKSGEEDV